METQTVLLEDLRLDPDNAREHDDRNLLAIQDSLTAHGQVHPIVLAKDGKTILAGNGRFQAMLDLGWTDCRAIVTELEGAEARAFALRDNRTAELADWDEDKLAEGLLALNEQFGADNLGWEDRELPEALREQWREDPGKKSSEATTKVVSFREEEWEFVVGRVSGDDSVSMGLRIAQALGYEGERT